MEKAKEQNSSDKKWGRIYIGTKDSELYDVEAAKSRAWSPKDEEEYLHRVRDKAEGMARDIIALAEADATSLRLKAQEEGYAEGFKRANAELEELRSSMSETVQAVLSAIEGQCSSIFSAWREDLTALVRMAVEKGIGFVLEENRAKMLEALYVQAVQSLDNHRNILVRVNPEDEPVVADIINTTKERFSELVAWKVKADASVSPGGMTVESESSLADNRKESRRAALENILATLNLPSL